MAPARRRSMGPLIAVILVVILVVVGVVAYAGIGYAYGQSRVTSARDTYNTAIDHANKYNDTINGLTSKLVDISSNTTTADLQQNKTLITQLTSSSQDAQATIAADDAALSQADSNLKQNSWLTVLSKSDIDRASTKIGHLRNALASATTITADYVQFGTFYQSFYDVLIDLDNLLAQENANSAAGVIAAVAKIKADSTKAISLDKAPGVAAVVATYLTDVQKAATDLTALYDAAAKGDAVAQNAAQMAVDQDVSKLDSDDITGASTETDAFYKPLLDAYNTEITAANNT